MVTEARIRQANGENIQPNGDDTGLDDECFVDNKRRVEEYDTWHNLDEYVRGLAGGYFLDHWQNQPCHIECWIEKDTTSSLVEDVCLEFGIPLRVSSGSFSRAFLIRAADRVHEEAMLAKQIHVLYVGDFDPKGISIEKTARQGNARGGARKREGLFDILQSKHGWTADECERRITWPDVEEDGGRIAVTLKDFRRLPDSLKVDVKQATMDEEKEEMRKGDALAPAYMEKYGELCAEVEAVEVRKLGIVGRRLEAAINKLIDRDTWEASERRQERDRKRLVRFTLTKSR